MTAYVDAFDLRLRAASDRAKAEPMARYLRDQFAFLGVMRPLRKAITREVVATHGLPEASELADVLGEFWALEYREAQYVGVELLQRSRRHLDAAALSWVEELITEKSWWDTVDALASHTVGTLFTRFPELRDDALARWRASGNLWLRRTALIFQLRYKERTDRELLFDLCRQNADRESRARAESGTGEFFIEKAIGWALREYSKHDATAVTAFVDTTDLAPLSRREALKWLKRRR